MSQVPPPYPQQPNPYPSQQPGPSPGQAAPSYGAPGFGGPQPAPGAPGSAPVSSDIRPRARWFWFGGGIVMLGVVAAVAFGVFSFFGIADTVDDFARVSPGTDTVRIDSTGKYVIYNEDGSSFATVEVTSPDGESVRTSPYLTALDYDFNGRSGSALVTFQANDTGSYTITTDTRIAVGPSIAGDLVSTILVPFVISGLGFLIGVIMIIVVAVRRSGSKKRAAAGY